MLHSYWNHSNVSLIPSMKKETRAVITALARKLNWKEGDQKLALLHSYLSKWQNSKSFEFLNISVTNALCWLRYNQREVLLFSLQSSLSQHNHTWQFLFGNQQRKKLIAKETHIFVAFFKVDEDPKSKKNSNTFWYLLISH